MRKFAMMLALLIFAGVQVVLAQTTITGTVTSSEDGKGIPGATVVVKGTTVGLTTDMNGKYSINVPASGKILQFSFVGMKTKEVTIGTQTVINVVLDPDIMDIEGVVVTALGISREKKSLGYAVQDVAAEDLTRTGNNNLLGALQGKVAGVEIKPSSGMPGASSQFQIRGARSFTGDNTPLYVVDGMPISSTPAYSTGNSVTGADISNRAIDINPADIESIEVLKGQAAGALYGIRASNGVILITTKSGKNNKVGRPIVNFSHTSSFDQVSRTPDYQTTYAQGTGGAYNPTASMSWGPKINDLPNDPVRGGNVVNDLTNKWGLQEGKFYVPQLDQAGLNPWVSPQVFNNWDDYFQTGYTMSNNISVSQGTNEGNYSLGFSNTDQTGIALNTGMTRYNVRANAERKLNKNFTSGFSANYSTVEIDKLSGANDGSLAGVLAAPSSYNLKGYPYHRPGEPTRQIYYRGGSFDNAYWVQHNNTFNEKTNRFANTIAELLDSTKNEMQRERAMKGFRIVEHEYQKLSEEIAVMEDSLKKIREYGVYDYESQSEMINQQLAIEIAKGNTSGIKALEEKLALLAKFGGAYVSLRDMLEHQKKQLSYLKARYEEAKVDATENLPQKFVVESAYKAEKKSYPVRWVIVLVSAVSAFLISVLLIISLDKIGKLSPIKKNSNLI